MMRWVLVSVGAIVFGVLVSQQTTLAAIGGDNGILIPYQGKLELNGDALSSELPYTFRFAIYDAPESGNLCSEQFEVPAAVYSGFFSLVIGPVPPGCVVGKRVFLSVSVRASDTEPYVQLSGRQQVFPSLAAHNSGEGDFAVSGNSTVGGNLAVAGSSSTASLLIDGSVGSIRLSDSPLLLRSGSDINHALAHRSSFGAETGIDGPALYGYTAGVLGTTSGGERAALRWNSSSNVSVSGNLSVAGTGGNVPHQCVIRTQIGSYNTACNTGEVAVGGGGRCVSGWRLTESLPWGGAADIDVPVNGQPARAWRSVCQVWGSLGAYAAPQLGGYAICCRQ